MATAQRKTKPSVLSNPILTLRREQARTSPFVLTDGEEERVEECTGKAPQRVNALIRHMHRQHSAYSNPTCAQRAPFICHTFDSFF